ncbi:MAG TPA: FtsX-like permease family protein [Bacteroidales bacterium]|nr:FtsX-like permease family protein [Bacteroidales bacterium]
MIWNISWKNVWRNKSRSMIVICAVTLGTISGVFVAGLMNGWVDQRIHSAIYTEVSHIKIQNPDYLINEEIKHTIRNYAEIESFLNQSEEVKSWTKHTKIVAMGSTSRGNTAITLKGIDPLEEKKVSDIYTYIVNGGGNYFESDFKNPIVISEKTADQLRLINYTISDKLIDTLAQLGGKSELIEKLGALKDKRFITEKKFKSELKKVLTPKENKTYGATIMREAKNYKLRSKIVFTFSGLKGEMSYQSYRVCGIYKTSNTLFDQMNAFVKQEDIADVAGLLPGNYHEVNIILNDETEDLKTLYDKLKSRFNQASVLSWKELVPDAGMMADFMTVYYYIIMGIIFFALAFGIINTMLMSVLERIKELGMLMAIGMNKKRVFRMIMLETIFLTLVGSLAGMVLGATLIGIFGKIGLNFASVQEGFEAVGWAAKVYPNINPGFFFGVIVMVIIIAILSSIIPARKALKLNPVEAIRTE